MGVAALNYLDRRMTELQIPYMFMRWDEDEEEPEYFFTGEYNEVESPNEEEDGRSETTIILRGFTRGSWLLLEQAKERIEKNITETAILDDGTGIAVFYDHSMVVQTSDANIKSIKINLTIQEWRV